MTSQQIKTNLKKYWNWTWHSDSAWSWVVALILIFIFIKLIFFPILSLIMGNALPIAGVESSSMDHQIVEGDYKRLTLCDKTFSKEEKQHINFNEYWETCGQWYEQRKISKQTFLNFPLKNGFSKGDIIIVWGRFTPKIGDIIVFDSQSQSPHPIIHRIVGIDEQGIIQTKGDHNERQLISNNNIFNTDETTITQDQIIGKAIIRIPLLGWPKIWFTDLINVFKK